MNTNHSHLNNTHFFDIEIADGTFQMHVSADAPVISELMNPQSLEKLVTMKMPFGKHAGRPLAHLPSNYLAWFAREGFPKSELGELLELMHTVDHNGLRGLLAPIFQAHGMSPHAMKP